MVELTNWERLSVTIKVASRFSRCDKKNGRVVSKNMLQIPSINTEPLGR